MPAQQSGSPMTFMVNGKQYIIIAVSGGNYSGEYICYSLPADESAGIINPKSADTLLGANR
jgi:hypothetical protein